MEEAKRAYKVYTPEQKFQFVQLVLTDIKAGMLRKDALIKNGVASSNFSKWSKQLEVGVKSSLRNGKSPADKEKLKLARENEKLKAIILSQSAVIADLKKETNWE